MRYHADALVGCGRRDEAISEYKQVLRLNGRDYEAAYRLADLYFKNKEYAEAREVLEHFQDNGYMIAANLGCMWSKICAQSGDLKKAQDSLRVPIEILGKRNPRVVDARKYLQTIRNSQTKSQP